MILSIGCYTTLATPWYGLVVFAALFLDTHKKDSLQRITPVTITSEEGACHIFVFLFRELVACPDDPVSHDRGSSHDALAACLVSMVFQHRPPQT